VTPPRTHSNPQPAVVAAYDADPSLAPYRLNFVTALRDALEIVLAGLLAERPSRASAGAATEAADMPRRRG
jgi:Tetracyclin repressor-like, C-terminal domain